MGSHFALSMMAVSRSMIVLVALLVSYAQSSSISALLHAMDDQCSDNWYGSCDSIPDFSVFTSDLTLEDCRLSCQVENFLGFCDWFIFEPKVHQSCKMFANSHGTMDAVLAGCTGKQGGPTCFTDGVDNDQCQATCGYSPCTKCGSGTIEHDRCKDVHDLSCTMPETTEIFPALSFDVCKQACMLYGKTYSFYDAASEAGTECHCYDTGDRICDSYIVSATVDAGLLEECASDKVPPRPTGFLET